MIILSVDYGDARTGIAVCDKFEILASPVCVIEEKNAEVLADKIKETAEKNKAEIIVVGLPKNMDSTEGFRAERCKEFADLLKSKTGIAVEMQDERLTTVSAHNVLNTVNVRGKKRKAVVDAVSAVMILQDFIDKRKNIAPEVK
ncbi:MAG: Holliday junction resolvase RuvX [Clostridia bacterium]|nr:Holliday junction resolvase RuvX [Clostridia bacterium]